MRFIFSCTFYSEQSTVFGVIMPFLKLILLWNCCNFEKFYKELLFFSQIANWTMTKMIISTGSFKRIVLNFCKYSLPLFITAINLSFASIYVQLTSFIFGEFMKKVDEKTTLLRFSFNFFFLCKRFDLKWPGTTSMEMNELSLYAWLNLDFSLHSSFHLIPWLSSVCFAATLYDDRFQLKILFFFSCGRFVIVIKRVSCTLPKNVE